MIVGNKTQKAFPSNPWAKASCGNYYPMAITRDVVGNISDIEIDAVF